ncbi:unnamed protein product [Tilletia controversa]|nr:unnamed protein product [Tilletia controversa]
MQLANIKLQAARRGHCRAAGHLRYRRPCWSAASPSKRWSSSPMLAFYGASFNPQLKMKTIKARDYSPYSIVLKELSSKPQGVFPVGPLETDAVLFGCAQDAEFSQRSTMPSPQALTSPSSSRPHSLNVYRAAGISRAHRRMYQLG